MKRFMFLLIGVILLASAVNAAPASISLYVIDHGAMISHKNIGWMQTDTIGIYYVQDRLNDPGHDLGNQLEFGLLSSNPQAIFTGAQWEDHITSQVGDVSTGIILGDGSLGSNCMRHQQDVVYIGDVYVFFTDASPIPSAFTIRVVGNENGDPRLMPPGLYISTYPCTGYLTFQSVSGGTFYFNCGECEPAAVDSKTWGAIKAMYK